MAELSSDNRDCMAFKAYNIYYLALYKKSLPPFALGEYIKSIYIIANRVDNW